MLRIDPSPLSAKSIRTLKSFQQLIDGEPDYASRVARAKKEWGNKRSSAALKEVAQQLANTSLTRRCHYCEDSRADEIEHVRPKDLYPERCFDWDNFLYACGPCNGPKSNKFAVIDGRGVRIDVGRKRGGPVVKPPKGRWDALIDPRKEDPMRFLFLEMARRTFRFVPHPNLVQKPVNRQRAEYTIEVLRLNDRQDLVEARADAFDRYISGVIEYVHTKMKGNVPTQRQKRSLQRGSHRTVWEEIKRQRKKLKLPDTDILVWHLFEMCPELKTF